MIKTACLNGLFRWASSFVLIAMTLIFRHFLIMPQKFGVNSWN